MSDKFNAFLAVRSERPDELEFVGDVENVGSEYRLGKCRVIIFRQDNDDAKYGTRHVEVSFRLKNGETAYTRKHVHVSSISEITPYIQELCEELERLDLEHDIVLAMHRLLALLDKKGADKITRALQARIYFLYLSSRAMRRSEFISGIKSEVKDWLDEIGFR